MSTRITVGNIKTMVQALNMVQDEKVSPTAKDYEWYSQGAPRIYALTRGGKVIIQGMHAADFYFACNAIAETITDTLKLHASVLEIREIAERARARMATEEYQNTIGTQERDGK
jgi:hypothetical protein